MFLEPNRKPVGRKRTVVCFLAFSLAFHAAVLVFFADSERVKERLDRVEVGLVSLPPGTTGGAGEGIAPVAQPRPVAGPAAGEKVSGPPSARPAEKKVARTATAVSGATDRPPDSSRLATASELPSAKRGSLPEQKQTSAEGKPQFGSAGQAGKIIQSLSTSPPPEPESAVSFEEGRASASAPLVEAMPRYDRNAPPPYPLLARKQGWEGEALLRVLVTETGAVRNVSVERSSGYAVLDNAALRAVRRWRFHPSRRGSTPVEGEALVPLRFKLRD